MARSRRVAKREELQRLIEKHGGDLVRLKPQVVDDVFKEWMFVFTPRTRNSRRARSMRRHAPGSVLSHAVTFTSSES